MENRYYKSLSPLVNWLEANRPLDLQGLFGNTGKFCVEIGFGQGHYLVARAQKELESSFIGIENNWTAVKMCLRKIAGLGLKNLKLIFCDAQTCFARLFPQKGIDEVVSLFPCPWPKERHHKRRLFSKQFLAVMNSRLKDAGRFLVVTDHYEYKEWIKENGNKTGFLVREKLTPPIFDTKYEKKWIAAGQKQFYYIEFTKLEHLDMPLLEDIKLRVWKAKGFDFDSFRPFVYNEDATVKLKELVYDKERQVAMFECLISEDGFVQKLWIEVRKKDEEWKVTPSKGSMFIPTKGVQIALDLIYDKFAIK